MSRPKGSKNKPKDIVSMPEAQLKPSLYQLKVLINNEVYESLGDDLYELLSDITPPAFIKTKTAIIVTRNNKTVRKDLKVINARRMFGNNRIREFIISNLIKSLG